MSFNVVVTDNTAYNFRFGFVDQNGNQLQRSVIKKLVFKTERQRAIDAPELAVVETLASGTSDYSEKELELDSANGAVTVESGADVTAKDLTVGAANNEESEVVVADGAVIDVERNASIGSGDNSEGSLEISGGALKVQDGGTLDIGAGTSSNLTVEVSNGEIAVTGNMNLGSGEDAEADISIDGGTVDVAGTLDIGSGEDSDAAVTVVDGLVEVSGTVNVGSGVDSVATVNLNGGSMEVDGTMSLATAEGSKATLEVASGDFKVDGDMVLAEATGSEADVVVSGGTVKVDNVVEGAGSATILLTGGVYSADTTEVQIEQVGGTISPGDSPGRARFEGGLTVSESATLLIELAGLVPSEDYDVINVSGNFIINGGTLNVVLLDGFTPSVEDVYRIFEFENIPTGTLSTYMLPNLGVNYKWSVANLYTLGTIEVLHKDTDNDGVNEIDDFYHGPSGNIAIVSPAPNYQAKPGTTTIELVVTHNFTNRFDGKLGYTVNQPFEPANITAIDVDAFDVDNRVTISVTVENGAGYTVRLAPINTDKTHKTEVNIVKTGFGVLDASEAAPGLTHKDNLAVWLDAHKPGSSFENNG